MDDRLFIESVREFPCLWNTTLQAYKDPEAKEVAWRRIMEKNKISDINVARKNWKKLRDIHREVLKKRRMRKAIGKPLDNCRVWKYFTQLSFILPYITNRERDIDDLVANIDNPQNDEDDEEIQQLFDPVETSDDPMSRTIKVETANQNTEIQNNETQRNNIEFITYLEDNDHLLEKEKNKKDDSRDDVFKTDPLASFFMAMCESTQRLPRYLQLRVKKELFNAVMTAEEECLMSFESPSTSYT